MLDLLSLSPEERSAAFETLGGVPSINLQNFINTISSMLTETRKALPNVKEIGLAENGFDTFLKDAARRKHVSFLVNFLEMIYPYREWIIKNEFDKLMNLDEKKLDKTVATDDTVSKIFMFKTYWNDGSLTENNKSILCKYVIGLLRHAIKFYEEKCLKLPENAKRLL